MPIRNRAKVTKIDVRQKQLMTTLEVAARLGVSESTVRKRAAKLGLYQPGGRYLLTPADEKLIRQALSDPTKRGPKPRTPMPD